MSQFSSGIWFETEHCCNCSMPFAMTTEFQKRRRKDHKLFYCPKGHPQHYTGKNEEQKLRDKLDRAERNYEAQAGRAALLEQQRNSIKAAHGKMRKRLTAGMCPCCNRVFQNFYDHMRTEHPDFGKEKTFKALRDAFGLTQSAIAQEIGVSSAHVSNYENDRSVAGYAKKTIENWMERTIGAE